MTLLSSVVHHPALLVPLRRRSLQLFIAIAFFLGLQSSSIAQSPDVLVLSNGDTLHGKLVNEIAGKVTFHTDALGDVVVGWDKIKELHAGGTFAVIDKTIKIQSRKNTAHIPEGPLDVTGKAVTVHAEGAVSPASIPVDNAAYIVDKATLDKQLYHEPGFFRGWNGAATAGATVINATQNQYTFSGGIGLVRIVPTANWLSPRDRTSMDFTGSFGKITQPSYVVAGTPPITVPSVVTKSAIYHAGAERDEYLSARFFALGQVAFDHNFAQDLDLQEIFGAGLGWTGFKTAKQEADLKATIQYEKQQFINASSGNQNLVGSTISLSYLLHHKMVTYTQGLAFIPAFNNPHAYSANETNTLAFPAYKNFSFSVATLDSYLNDPPSVVSLTQPPVKRNSFQFTMGMTYAIKSKY